CRSLHPPRPRPAGPRPIPRRPEERRRRSRRASVSVSIAAASRTVPFRPLYREGRVLRLLDQRLLPAEEVWLDLESSESIADAIRDMAVRGAPAIGAAAAYAAAFAIPRHRHRP